MKRCFSRFLIWEFDALTESFEPCFLMIEIQIGGARDNVKSFIKIGRL